MSKSGTWIQALATMATIATVIISVFSFAQSYQANNIATQANNIAFSAYSVVNNYPPYIDVSSRNLLVLRPTNCAAKNDTYVECELAGDFNFTLTIVAAHDGIYNVSSIDLTGLGPFSQPAHHVVGIGPQFVQVANATISTYPPFRSVTTLSGTVQGGQPVERTVEVEIAGLKVTMPSSISGSPIVTGFCTLTAVLTCYDIQFQVSYPRSFTIQAQIILAAA